MHSEEQYCCNQSGNVTAFYGKRSQRLFSDTMCDYTLMYSMKEMPSKGRRQYAGDGMRTQARSLSGKKFFKYCLQCSIKLCTKHKNGSTTQQGKNILSEFKKKKTHDKLEYNPKRQESSHFHIVMHSRVVLEVPMSRAHTRFAPEFFFFFFCKDQQLNGGKALSNKKAECRVSCLSAARGTSRLSGRTMRDWPCNAGLDSWCAI